MRLLITFSAFLLSATLYGQVPNYVPINDLIAWYSFDNGANDLSGNEFEGAIYGAQIVESNFGNALLFDGIDDYVEIPTNDTFENLVDELTLSAWFHKTSTSNGSIIAKRNFVGNPCGERHHFELTCMADNSILFSAEHNCIELHTSQIQSDPNVFQLNTWNHVALTYQNGSIHLFLNGELILTHDEGYRELLPNAHWINFGRVHRSGGTPFFNEFWGQIDESGIWSRALSFDEIADLYNSTSPIQGCTDSLANNFNPEATLDDGTCCYVNIAQNDTTICEGSSISLNVTGDLQNGLVAYYPFNGNANDESGNGNNGTVNNAILALDRFGNNNSAYNFDGNNDYIEVLDDNSIDLSNTNYTISAWVFINDVGTEYQQAIITKRGEIPDEGYHLVYNSVDDEFVFQVSGGGDPIIQISANNAIGTWNNIVVTFESIGNTTSFYLNGVLAITSQSINPVNSTLSNLFFGRTNVESTVNYYLDGNLDDIGLWNKALTSQEIQELYSGSSILSTSNYLWSTGDTTASITVTPTQTTTYWVEQTENGVTCTDEVTITVQSTGCGNSDACNFTEGDACDIDCVFALFENDCNAGAVACGEGTVWDANAQECIVANPTDTNFDGCTDLNDLLDILAAYGECAVADFTCGDDIEHEGYNYSTVQIGDQCWFSENCRYLPVVSPSSEGSDTDPYYYVYDYQGTDVTAAQATANYETYGVLYNWPAAITEGLCPSSWYVPTDTDFTQLTDFLDGESVAGGKMKEAGYDHWISPNEGATNSSGFTGLPGGDRDNDGSFYSIGTVSYFWSSSSPGSNIAWHRALFDDTTIVDRSNDPQRDGMSARCIKD